MVDHRISTAEFLELVKPGGKRRGKFGNNYTEYNGRVYHSKKEAEYAAELDLLKRAGKIRAWIPQVGFPVATNSKVKYVLDFFIINNDGTFRMVDVKGYDTRQSKTKRQLILENYGVEIETP